MVRLFPFHPSFGAPPFGSLLRAPTLPFCAPSEGVCVCAFVGPLRRRVGSLLNSGFCVGWRTDLIFQRAFWQQYAGSFEFLRRPSYIGGET